MNEEEHHKHRKYWLLCILAVFIAIVGVILPEQEDIAFEIIKNNTDLCDFNHTSGLCNGIRQSNVTYYTNDSTIILTVYAHANTASQTAGVFVYRDNILIEAQSGRPLAVPEETWRGVTVIMPRNTSYRVNFTNYHHFNWTEDQILSGRNGTLSINQTVIGGAGCTGDCSFNNLSINSLNFNNTPDSYIHLLAPFETIIGNVQTVINTQGIFSFLLTNLTTGNGSQLILSNDYASISITNGTNNYMRFYHNRTESQFVGGIPRTYLLNDSYFDMDGANLTNCANCDSNLNLKVNKTGDNMTGKLGTNSQILMTPDYMHHISSIYDFELIRNNSAFFGIGSYAGAPSNGVYLVSQTGRGNMTNPLPLNRDQLMFSFVSVGYKTNTTISGTTARYSVWADGDWNSTSTPTRLMFSVVNNGTTAATDALVIKNDSSVTINNLKGVGSAYACLDANGGLYRGSPGC